MAFAINKDNSFEAPISLDEAFRFCNIEIREAYQINSTDLARIALNPDDNPYIPDSHKSDAPVLQVLNELKGILRNRE